MRGSRGLAWVAGPLFLAAAMAAEESSVALIPVFTWDPLPGVNGSSWTTELWISNSGTAVAGVDGLAWDCFLPQCGAAPVAPGVSFPSGPSIASGLRGALLRMDAGMADAVQFQLRFRDLSRQTSTAGTEVPVPRGDDFRSTRFSLLDVPVEQGFRQTLRIYELDGTEREARVRIRLWQPRAGSGHPNGEPDELLGDVVLPLEFTPQEFLAAEYPGYAQVTDLSTIAPLGGAESVRIEIEPVTEGLRLWAFVTVIHNETQHATVISPQ
jgi:hypothetical protein